MKKPRINPTLHLEGFREAKIAFFTAVCMAGMTISAHAAVMGIKRSEVPRVAYLEPGNQTTVDLAGKDSIVFKWKNNPIPGGGREAYRFRLFKGYDYGSIVSEVLDQGVYSIEVPADKFENGSTYSWYVEQRDAALMVWSLHDTWTFKVKK